MRVKALKTGFYEGRLIEAGETFTAEGRARSTWFVPEVDHEPPQKAKVKAKAEPAGEPKPEPDTGYDVA